VVRPRGGVVVQEAPDRVRADAAVTINALVRWTVGRGLAGLEAWAGTPGTVGGGVYGNAHWGGRLLSDVLHSVRLWSAPAGVFDVDPAAMAFGYDRSRLQQTGEVLVSAAFVVGAGEPAVLREIARRSLAYRKRTQPLHVPSAGCIFQNPAADEPLPDGMPRSAGALVDRAGLKGARVGGAEVSMTHGNFIVNEGAASARDIRALVEQCRQAVEARFHVRLRDEIVYLGEFLNEQESAGVHTAD
jgi:UDP-N-acetylmuramate dehydrogenase